MKPAPSSSAAPSSPVLRGSLLLLFLALAVTTLVAAPAQNNNAGTWTDGYNDASGISIFQNTVHDSFARSVSLAGGENQGSFTSTLITPSSFDAWVSLTLDASFADPSEITVSLLNPLDGDAVIAGFDSLPYTGALALAGLDPVAHPSVKVRINLTQGADAPAVRSLEVRWNPRSVLAVGLNAPASVQSGDTYTYRVQYSVSFVNTSNLVVWLPLPADARGTAVPPEDFGQIDDPTFVSANNGGQYTAAGATISGVVVPPNSVFWNLGNANAGDAFAVTTVIRCKAGTLNGTQLRARAFARAGNSAEVQTVERTTVAQASAAADVTAGTTEGVFLISGKRYTDPGTLNDYFVRVANSPGNGRETLYDLTLYEDLTPLLPVLDEGGDGLDIGDFSGLTDGAQLVPDFVPPLGGAPRPALVWTVASLAPGTNFTGNFQIRIKPAAELPPDGITFLRSVTAESSRLARKSGLLEIEAPLPNNAVFQVVKGLRIRGATGVSAGNDLPALEVADGELFQFLVNLSNSGAVAVNDVVFVDKIPAGTEFESAFLPPVFGGSVFYSTTTDPAFTTSSPPPVDPDNTPEDLNPAGENFWQNLATDPPAEPTAVTWVAFHVPTVASPFFPIGMPSSVTAEIGVRPRLDDPCVSGGVSNQARVSVFRKTPTTGPPLVDAGADGPIHVLTDTESVGVAAVRPTITASNASMSPAMIFSPANAEVTFQTTLGNANLFNGAPLGSSEVRLQWQPISINGVPTLPELISLSPNALIAGDAASGDVTVDFGALAMGQSRAFSATFRLPASGFANHSQLQANATISWPGTCPPTSLSRSASATILAQPGLQVVAQRSDAFAAPGGEIACRALVTSSGTAPSTKTFVVAPIPSTTVFVRAPGPVDRPVYFSETAYPDIRSVTYPPSNPNFILSNFTIGIHSDNGTPGDETDDFWISPFGEATTTAAFLLDDPGTNLFPTTASREVSWVLRNDEDRGPAQVDSPEGTVITVEVGIFSAELLMAISNAVTTMISETASPEFTVFDGADEAAPVLADGQEQVVDFGLTVTGEPVSRLFSIRNDGADAFAFQGLALPAGFVASGAPLPGSLIGPGEVRGFEVRLAAASPGTFGGFLRLSRFEGDSHPFTFPISGRVSVEFPAGMFAMGDFDSITPGVNDEPSRTVVSGQSFHHWLRFTNLSPLRLQRIVMIDKIPDFTVFEALELIDSEITNGTLFYSTTTDESFTATNPPPIDPGAAPATLDAAGNSHWRNLLEDPPADPAEVKWIAVFVPLLNSQQAAEQPAPKVALARLQLRAAPADPGNPGGPITNTGLARVYEKIPLSGAPAIPADGDGGPVQFTDTEITALAPLVPSLTIAPPGASITPNPVIGLPQEIEFSFTVKNGEDAGNFSGGLLDLFWDEIIVGNVIQFPQFISVNPSTNLTDFSQFGFLSMDFEALASGEERAVVLRLGIPAGTAAQNFRVAASIFGPGANLFTSAQTTLLGNPQVAVAIDQLPATTAPGARIDFRAQFENTGDNELNTVLFMPVPPHVVFEGAFGDSGEFNLLFTNQPPPADGAPGQDFIEPLEPAQGILNDNGTPDDPTDDFWTSPFGEATTGVSFVRISGPLPIDSGPVEVRWTGINDDDPGPGQSPSPPGTVITARATVLATVPFDTNILTFTATPTTTTIGGNSPPVWLGYHIHVKQGQNAPVALIKLLARASDPDGNALSLTVGEATTANAASVVRDGDTITYTPPSGFTGEDQFELVLRNPQTAVAAPVTVTVTPYGDAGPPAANGVSLKMVNGRAEIGFAGIPGRIYPIQRSTDMSFWETIGSVEADETGRILFIDNAPPRPNGFYRVLSIP